MRNHTLIRARGSAIRQAVPVSGRAARVVSTMSLTASVTPVALECAVTLESAPIAALAAGSRRSVIAPAPITVVEIAS